jgi:hypothetical protein
MMNPIRHGVMMAFTEEPLSETRTRYKNPIEIYGPFGNL